MILLGAVFLSIGVGLLLGEYIHQVAGRRRLRQRIQRYHVNGSAPTTDRHLTPHERIG